MQKIHMEKLLKKASEIVNKVNDPELDAMIHKLDNTPASELNIDIQDHMHIYNWLRELELYHALCGPLNKI